MTDYTDLIARLRTFGHFAAEREEAADAIAALTAERDALREALREAEKAIGDFGDDLTYVEGERDLHSRAYEIMRGIRAALTAKP